MYLDTIVTLQRVTCIKPAAGIDKLTEFGVMMLTRAVKEGVTFGSGGVCKYVELGLEFAGPGVDEIAEDYALELLHALDEKYSGTDNLYIQLNNKKIWPAEAFRDTVSGTTHKVQYAFRVKHGETATISLVEHDLGPDDPMGNLVISGDHPIGTYLYMVTEPEEEKSVYAIHLRVNYAEGYTDNRLIDQGKVKQACVLFPEMSLSSPNLVYTLKYQLNGDLVMYRGNEKIWASNTAGKMVDSAIFQKDGNLVVYEHRTSAVWASGKYGPQYQGGTLSVQDDGHVVLRDSKDAIYWRSPINCSCLDMDSEIGGGLKWAHVHAHLPALSPPCIRPAASYFQSTNNMLLKLPVDGSSLLWLGNNRTISTPFSSGGYVYFQGTDSRLNRVAVDGSVTEKVGGCYIKSSPYVYDGYVYFQGLDDKLMIAKGDGSATSTVGNLTTKSTPMFFTGYIYFQGSDNKLYRVKPDGTDLTNVGGKSLKSSPYVIDGVIYFQALDDKLWRVNVDGSGAQNLAGCSTASTPSVDGGYVYFRGLDNKLRRVKTDGDAASVVVGGAALSSPIPIPGGNGRVLVQSKNNYLVQVTFT